MYRTDGYRVHTKYDPMYEIVPHIMNRRLDATNNIKVPISLDPIQDYTRKCRKNGTPMSHMAVIIAAYVRVASQNPLLNRFSINRKVYARNHFCVSFVTLVPQTGGETVNKVYFDLDDTIFEVNEKLANAIDLSKVQLEDNAMDKFANAILRIPGLLRIGVSFLKFLDRMFTMPFWAVNASPFHTSFWITNLASIRTAAVQHHLYEFGTSSVFLAMGKPELKTYINDDGEVDQEKIIELSITTDERIASGSYLGRCFRELEKYLKNPTLLEEKPEKVVKDPDIVHKNPKWISKYK